MTQAQLAEKLGIRQNMISDYERGKRRLSPSMAKRIAKILKIKVDLKGLDEESAAGKVAREVLVDYGAVPRSYQLLLSRGLMPFVRFSEGNLRNYARAITRNKGTHRAWKTITPIVVAYTAQWAYNNLDKDKKN